jgi:RimJ/RimL family protein N-acetyltransferase
MMLVRALTCSGVMARGIIILARMGRDAIETPRLRLRPYVPGDADCVLRFVAENRARLQAVLTDWALAMNTLEDAREFVRAMRIGWITRKIILFGCWTRATDELCGEVMLFRFDPARSAAEIGYYLAARYEGHGLAAESVRACVDFGFDMLGLQLITAGCARSNLRSQQTALRCGFVAAEESADSLRFELAARRDSDGKDR